MGFGTCCNSAPDDDLEPAKKIRKKKSKVKHEKNGQAALVRYTVPYCEREILALDTLRGSSTNLRRTQGKVQGPSWTRRIP